MTIKDVQVVVEGCKTEEGRLKIEEIKKLKGYNKSNILNGAVLAGLLYFLGRVVLPDMKPLDFNDYDLSKTISVLCVGGLFIGSANAVKNKIKGTIYNKRRIGILEDEIIHPKVK